MRVRRPLRRADPHEPVLAKLRALAKRPRVHPFRTWLAERGISIEEAAEAFEGLRGFSTRSIKAMLDFERHPFPYGSDDELQAKVAAALGYDDPTDIFPYRPK